MSREFHRVVAAVVCALLVPVGASAEPGERGGDIYELRAHSETYAQLFRRALLPGPNGALVVTDTAAPFNQYISLGGYGFASPLGEDSVDVELAVWGGVEAGEPLYLGRFDGDVQTANVVLHGETPLAPRVRLGRQQVAGGAARFARFDGLAAGVAVVPELTLSAYGGYTVLPRWDRRPGYYQLGAAADTLLRDPEALDAPERSGYWLAGGKLAFEYGRVRAAASVHEQRESSEVGRRNLGLDAGAMLGSHADVGGNLLFDLDATHIADMRVFADATAWRVLDLNAEYQRVEPALLLSHQSVLSVFGTDGYHEAGGSFRWRLDERFSVGSGGWVEFYDGFRPGARVNANARYALRSETVAIVGYTRVIAPDNGYNSVSAALSQRLFDPLTATLQLYTYLYDEPIEGYTTSSVYSGTLEYAFLERLALLWGGSVAQSPYASLDASTLLRLSYELDRPARRHEW